jgi:Sigma-70, region 4
MNDVIPEDAGLSTPVATDNRNIRDTRKARTYRELAGRLGWSLATTWRRVNRGRPMTLTVSRRSERFALVLFYRGQGLSIRRVASELAISRGAVERELCRARRLADHGLDPFAVARQTLANDELWKRCR